MMKNNIQKFIKFFIGILFVFSGLIKANDPLGLAYKMDEFFEIFNVSFLNNWSLGISLFIINLEILLGLCLIFNLYLKSSLHITIALTIFFAFLTGYAVFSGKIKTCGCFGDCIPLSAMQSFCKDLILLILVVILWQYFKNKKIKPLSYAFKTTYVAMCLVALIEILVLLNLPYIDCLPYKKNANIINLMKNSGSTKTSKEIIYQYYKNNDVIEFSANNFPKDFDSTYIYINRRDKIIQTDKSTTLPLEFDMLDYDLNNRTTEILNNNKTTYLLFIRNMEDLKLGSFDKIINKIQKKSFFENTLFYIISSQNIDTAILTSINLKQRLLCDKVILKTISRSSISLYTLLSGVIKSKHGLLYLKYIYE